MSEYRSPVYVIVNTTGALSQPAERIVRAALEGGAGMLQLRAKGALGQAELRAFEASIALAREAGVPLVINDHVELARSLGADGVHVGLTDTSVPAARQMLGREAIVGATTPTPELAIAAQEAGASYVAVGSIFPSSTRPDKQVVGLGRLTAVAEAVSVPVCAIGGITAERMPDVLAAGADLAAVIGAVADAPDPLVAVRELVAACRSPSP